MEKSELLAICQVVIPKLKESMAGNSNFSTEIKVACLKASIGLGELEILIEKENILKQIKILTA